MYTPGYAPQQQIAPMPQEQPQVGRDGQQPASQQQAKPKTPGKSKGNDIGGFIQQLISLAAYLHQLQVQSHLLHFNLEAPYFLSMHKFLGKQYEAHQDQFDKIGEFIRSMNYLLPSCHNGLMEASPQFNHCTNYKPNDMLMVYYKNLEELGMKCKKLMPVANKIGAPDIENYLAELVGEAFKASWMIKSCLRNA